MPTYKYRREDGSTFEIRQKITEDALDECPDTGQPVQRVITGGMGFQLKGGGWYADGYGSSGNGAPGQEKSDAAGESKSGSESDGEKGSKKEAAKSESAGKGEGTGEKKASASDAA